MPAPRNDYLLPASIIVAAVLISGAWVYSAGLKYGTPKPAQNPGINAGAETRNEMNLATADTITAADHILGDPNAPVKIIEYSDLECPFCKVFHVTMKKVLAEYGSPGKVAWVYRHFPIESLHSRAIKESEASECAAELGGNDAFWAYVDRIFEITPSNNGLHPDELLNVARYIGLDSQKFEACLTSGKHQDAILQAVSVAESAGARGTPYSVVLSKEGRRSIINGAESISKVRAAIEDALR